MRWKPPDGEYRSHLPPTIDDTEEDLAARELIYDAVPPDTFVISGPLPGGAGPGRRFESTRDAYRWCRERYGDRFVHAIPDAHPGGRWAARVRRSGSAVG